MEKIYQYVPTADLNEVNSALVAKGVLKLGKEKRTIQIAGGGKRFYAIKLKKLFNNSFSS